MFLSTLQRYRDTLLGSEELDQYFDEESGEHVIDTDPQVHWRPGRGRGIGSGAVIGRGAGE